VAVALLLGCCLAARAEEDDMRSLELYNGAEVEAVSAGRSPRPASQTAENITVITAADIEALHAHTLADVLYTVPGVQLEMYRTPGTASNVQVQGAGYYHILVQIDNVPINNLYDNYPDIASLPVQMIERIEIVKGAASSSWGSALGGVINIITKAPATDRLAGALGSVSYGQRGTVDGRGEVSGSVNRLGYYLTGGRLTSAGLLANNMVDLRSFYGKIRYELPLRGSLTLTGGVIDNASGQLAADPYDFNQDSSLIFSTATAQFHLSDAVTLDVSGRFKRLDQELDVRTIADNTLAKIVRGSDGDNGGSLKLSWQDDMQRLVAGVDYDHLRSHLTLPFKQADMLWATAERVGIYLNDTITLGRFAVTPSVRYDRTGITGDLLSPSFGVTYALTDNTVLRGYTARGYSLVSLNRDNATEKVWTSQVGIESAEIPNLWLKGTLFRNDTWNVHIADDQGVSSWHRQLKQGVEVEGRTLPYLGTSLSVGYTYIYATDADSGSMLHGVPRHTLDLGVKFEDRRYLRALLTGHYIDWNGDGGPGQDGRYGAVIWDLHLDRTLLDSVQGKVELFFSVRNIFNGEQELAADYRNAGRWIEGGIRCGF
jgi:vitamin B12 transporter